MLTISIAVSGALMLTSSAMQNRGSEEASRSPLVLRSSMEDRSFRDPAWIFSAWLQDPEVKAQPRPDVYTAEWLQKIASKVHTTLSLRAELARRLDELASDKANDAVSWLDTLASPDGNVPWRARPRLIVCLEAHRALIQDSNLSKEATRLLQLLGASAVFAPKPAVQGPDSRDSDAGLKLPSSDKLDDIEPNVSRLEDRLKNFGDFFAAAGNEIGAHGAIGSADMKGLSSWIAAVGLRTLNTRIEESEEWWDDAGFNIVAEYKFKLLDLMLQDLENRPSSVDEPLKKEWDQFEKKMDPKWAGELTDPHLRRSHEYLTRLRSDPPAWLTRQEKDPELTRQEKDRELRLYRLLAFNEFCGWLAPGLRWNREGRSKFDDDETESPFLRVEIADLVETLLQDVSVANALCLSIDSLTSGELVRRAGLPAAVSRSPLGMALQAAQLPQPVSKFADTWFASVKQYNNELELVINQVDELDEVTPEAVGRLADRGLTCGQLVALLQDRRFRPLAGGRAWLIEASHAIVVDGEPGKEAPENGPTVPAADLLRQAIEACVRQQEMPKVPKKPDDASPASSLPRSNNFTVSLDLVTEALGAVGDGAITSSREMQTWLVVEGATIAKAGDVAKFAWPAGSDNVRLRRGLASAPIARLAEDSAPIADAVIRGRLPVNDQMFWQDAASMFGVHVQIALPSLNQQDIAGWLSSLQDATVLGRLCLADGGGHAAPIDLPVTLKSTIDAMGKVPGLGAAIPIGGSRSVMVKAGEIQLDAIDGGHALLLRATAERNDLDELAGYLMPIIERSGEDAPTLIRPKLTRLHLVPPPPDSGAMPDIRLAATLAGEAFEFDPADPGSVIAPLRAAIRRSLKKVVGGAEVAAIDLRVKDGRIIVGELTAVDPEGSIDLWSHQLTADEISATPKSPRRSGSDSGDGQQTAIRSLNRLRARWLKPLRDSDVQVTAPPNPGGRWTVDATLHAQDGGLALKLCWTPEDLATVRACDFTVANTDEIGKRLRDWLHEHGPGGNRLSLVDLVDDGGVVVDRTGHLELKGSITLQGLLPPVAGADGVPTVRVSTRIPVLSPTEFSASDISLELEGVTDRAISLYGGFVRVSLGLSKLRLVDGRLHVPYRLEIHIADEVIDASAELVIGLDGSIDGGIDGSRAIIVEQITRRLNALVAKLLREKLGVLAEAIGLDGNLGKLADRVTLSFDPSGWIALPMSVGFDMPDVKLSLDRLGPISGLDVSLLGLRLDRQDLFVDGVCLEAAKECSIAGMFKVTRFKACVSPDQSRVAGGIGFEAGAVSFDGGFDIPLDGNGRWAGDFDLLLSGQRVAKAGLTIDPSVNLFGGSLAMNLGGVIAFDGSLEIHLDQFALDVAGSGSILGVDLGDAAMTIDTGTDRYGGSAAIDFKFYRVAAGLYVNKGELEQAWGDFFSIGPVSGGVGVRGYRPQLRATFIVTITITLPRFDEIDSETIINLFRNLFDPTRWLQALIPPRFSTDINLFGSGGGGGGGPGDGDGGGGGDGAGGRDEDVPTDALRPPKGRGGASNGWFVRFESDSQQVFVAHKEIDNGQWKPYAIIQSFCPPAGVAAPSQISKTSLTGFVVGSRPEGEGLDRAQAVVLCVDDQPRFHIERDESRARMWDGAAHEWAACSTPIPPRPLPPLLHGGSAASPFLAVNATPNGDGWGLEVRRWGRNDGGELKPESGGPVKTFYFGSVQAVPRVTIPAGQSAASLAVSTPMGKVRALVGALVVTDGKGEVESVLVAAEVEESGLIERQVYQVTDAETKHAGWPSDADNATVLLTAEKDAIVSRVLSGGRLVRESWPPGFVVSRWLAGSGSDIVVTMVIGQTGNSVTAFVGQLGPERRVLKFTRKPAGADVEPY